jgi:hypothetical protein
LISVGGYCVGNIQIAVNSTGQSNTSNYQITPYANMISALDGTGTTAIPAISDITLSATYGAGTTTLNLVVTSTGANFGTNNDVEAIVSYCYNAFITTQTP